MMSSLSEQTRDSRMKDTGGGTLICNDSSVKSDDVGGFEGTGLKG
jgi:hypothetical protein